MIEHNSKMGYYTIKGQKQKWIRFGTTYPKKISRVAYPDGIWIKTLDFGWLDIPLEFDITCEEE